MRLFLGVFPPPAILARLRALRERLQRVPGLGPERRGARWVAEERWHLTLCFLGEQSPDVAARLLEHGRTRIAAIPRFDVDLEGVGGFPDPRRARVLWVGVGRGREGVDALASAVFDAVDAAGVTSEREGFHAHLTLARAGRQAIRVPVGENVSIPGMPVAEVALVHSRLSGPVQGYEVIEALPLGEA